MTDAAARSHASAGTSAPARRWALFLCMLISGGMLVFPRVPLLLAVIVLALLATRGRLATPNRLVWIGLLLGLILLGALVRPGPLHLESLAIRYSNFLGALVLLNMYLVAGLPAFGHDLRVILKWMAVQAVLTFVLANAAGFLFVPVQLGETTYQTLLGLFTYHEFIEDAAGWKRPDGFFFEPGVFQIYLNMYLYLALFVFRRKGQAALALAAVICTQSTTGILICMLQLIVALWQRAATRGMRHKLLAVTMALVFVPTVAYLGYTNVVDKLSGESQGSSWAREYDFFTGINVISEYPLLGIGFDHARYLAVSEAEAYADSRLSEEGMEDRATSNGLIYLFYSLGLPLGAVIFIAMFRQQFFPHRWLIGALLALSLFGEALVFTPFILLIVFSAFVARRRKTGARVLPAEGLAA